MITRRGLLAGMLVACVAPAFVRSESLMILPAPRKVWTGGVDMGTGDNGMLNIYNAAGILLASVDIGDMAGGSFSGWSPAIETGKAAKAEFILPNAFGPKSMKFTTDVGVPGSGAGFIVSSPYLMSGGVFSANGSLMMPSQ